MRSTDYYQPWPGKLAFHAIDLYVNGATYDRVEVATRDSVWDEVQDAVSTILHRPLHALLESGMQLQIDKDHKPILRPVPIPFQRMLVRYV